MESNEEIKQHYIKMNFFQKIWYSILKFEKYPELAALGIKKALLYFIELVLIASIIFTAIYVYYIKNVAEFDQDLNFSEKITSILTKNINVKDEQLAIENLKKQKSETLVLTIEVIFFITLFIGILCDVLMLSLFGIITCVFAKIKMNYKALFNMSIYAFTLSIILRTIYFAIITLTTFRIKYFDIMYIAIAYISLAAAIFIIKSNVIKQHLELMRILEESKEKIEEEFPIYKEPKDEEKENDKDEEEKEEKNNNTDKNSVEGQGSNA